MYVQDSPFPLLALPRHIFIKGEKSVEEADEAHYCSEEQHLGVEAQPSEIHSYLLPVVLPVYSQREHHTSATSSCPAVFTLNLEFLKIICDFSQGLLQIQYQL